MSSEAAAPRDDLKRTVEVAHRAALRLAFGVTASFAVVEALEWDASFLAPLLAANMLVKLDRPPSLRQGLLLVALVLGLAHHHRRGREEHPGDRGERPSLRQRQRWRRRNRRRASRCRSVDE